MTVQVLVLVATALAGGLAPLVLRHSDRLLHLFVAVATGLFLGTVFLHLLPEVAHPHAGADHHDPLIWVWVLVGVLGLYLIEKFAFSGRNHADPHLALGWGSFFGLSIHGLTTGMGLAAVASSPSLETALFLSIASHRVAEAFSLATIFLLAGFSRRRVAAVVLLFSFITPIGLLTGSVLLHDLTEVGVQRMTALAAGTFLFVAVCELLPEVFHERRDRVAKVLLLLAGMAASLLFKLH